MIQLQPATDWPVPYIDRATISGELPLSRCGTCRQIKTLRFFYVGRNVAKGPKHGGEYSGEHNVWCNDCIDEYLSTRADVRSVIKDGRSNSL